MEYLDAVGTWDAELDIKRNWYLGCRVGIFRGVGTWDAEVEPLEV
jgi:hypothetical protein